LDLWEKRSENKTLKRKEKGAIVVHPFGPDGSKSQEGSGAGCILIDHKGKRHFLSFRLEFECTNNIFEYEALVQGLKKAIDLDVKELKVYGDSEIIVR
jgi:ribonuclease HI